MNLSNACSILTIAALASPSSAFAPLASNAQPVSALQMGTPGMDLSGNSWKPDSEKMGVSRLDQTKIINHSEKHRKNYGLFGANGWGKLRICGG